MAEDTFLVFDGGRPDDESSILLNLAEIARAYANTKGKYSLRVAEIEKRLSNDSVAEKYLRFVLFKLGAAQPLIAKRDWMPALHTLLEAITPSEKALKMIDDATKSAPSIYDSDTLKKQCERGCLEKRTRSPNDSAHRGYHALHIQSLEVLLQSGIS